jgi:hypothetical protein
MVCCQFKEKRSTIRLPSRSIKGDYKGHEASEVFGESDMSPHRTNNRAQIIDLENVDFTPELWSSIPAAVALKYRVLPVAFKGKCLVIALADARNIKAIDGVHAAVAHKYDVLDVRIADEGQLELYVEEIYGE